MLTLYYKPTCVYSQDVMAQAESLGLTLNLKDVSNDPILLDELMALGEHAQTPFLTDSEKGTKLYESDAIIDYLKEYEQAHARSSFGGLHIHQSDEICDSCQ